MENNLENNETQTIAAQTVPQENELVKEDFKRIIETLLFITDRPLGVERISHVAEVNNLDLTREIIEELRGEYASGGRAIQILEIGGGFQLATKPEYGRWVRKLYNEKMSAKLSSAALETLAIIAYKQPITRAEIEAIRGVDIIAPLEKIMERGLVRIVGKKDTPGRPMVYGTTEEFLRIFGLNKMSELPDIASFSDKGAPSAQSDLPFGESLPDVKENILPLTEEEELANIRSGVYGGDASDDDAMPTETAQSQTPSAQTEEPSLPANDAEEIIKEGMNSVDELKNKDG
ncbi:MAG: SMC-Scp complex subunit ScpB [Elusimicrobiota bacterium]|jgi:segregation and condensation protein B|nr:SMC-Scp complex subunit ScpB [Elusimicrobiota bacterium]